MLIVPTLQEKNLEWFPRMRAMSLTAEDAEGEQNELRNLQQQLEITNKLVQGLSGQLAELKEQVTAYVDIYIYSDPSLKGHSHQRTPLINKDKIYFSM